MKQPTHFTVEFTDRALNALERLQQNETAQIVAKIGRLEGGLVGDIKKLHGREAIYRLRSGKFRVLFEILGRVIVIHDVGDRKNIYR